MANISETSSTGRTALPSPSYTAQTEPGAGVPRQIPSQLSDELQVLSTHDRPAGQANGAMAPRARLPLVLQDAAVRQASAVAGEVSLASARRTMAPLVEAYDQAKLTLVALYAKGSRELHEGFIHAAKGVLDHYAGLPRRLAIRTLPDNRVREMHDLMIEADRAIHAQLIEKARALGTEVKRLNKVLERLTEANHQREPQDQIDLSKLFLSLGKAETTHAELWEDCAARLDLMIPTLSSVAHVLGTSPQLRETEDSVLRQLAAHLATARLMGLEARVGAAMLDIPTQLEAQDSPVEENPLGDAIWRLGTLETDILPAFHSTYLVVNQFGPLADNARTVLDDVVARLQEFASVVDDVTDHVHAASERGDAPGGLVATLNRISEAVWIAANDVKCLLDLDVQAPPDKVAPRLTEQAGSPAPAAAATDTEAAGRPSKGRSKKGKAKEKTAAAQAVPAPSAPTSSPASSVQAASATVLGRSALGTRLLVEPERAAAIASPATPPELPMQQLTRMLSFDLPGQQREISRARSPFASPENAEYVVEQSIKRLEAQAVEMQSCLAALSNPRERLRLSGPQLVEAHRQTEQLKQLLPQVEGFARSLMEGMHANTLEHMKTYAFPTQAHIEQLRKAGELTAVEAPRALKSEPGTLFEIKLQPAPLRNGALPRPMWLHLHTRQPVKAQQLPELRDADFTACHVKSDVERGRNREWQNAQAAAGRESVMIYRGKLEPALCRSLMTA